MIGQAVLGSPAHRGVVITEKNVKNSELSFCRLVAEAAALEAGLVLPGSRRKTYLTHDGTVEKKIN